MKSNLMNYLPQEIRKIEEFEQICISENLEFDEINRFIKEVFDASFIESASEYGITRLENIAGITSNINDTLEDRRFRLMVRFQFNLPYTLITLLERLDSICGKDNYDLVIKNNVYEIILKTKLTTSGQFDELYFLLEQVIPANMLVVSTNELIRENSRDLYFSSSVTTIKEVTIDTNIQSDYLVSRGLYQGVAISDYKKVTIDNNLDKKFEIKSDSVHGHNISYNKYIKINTKGMI